VREGFRLQRILMGMEEMNVFKLEKVGKP